MFTQKKLSEKFNINNYLHYNLRFKNPDDQ